LELSQDENKNDKKKQLKSKKAGTIIINNDCLLVKENIKLEPILIKYPTQHEGENITLNIYIYLKLITQNNNNYNIYIYLLLIIRILISNYIIIYILFYFV